MRRIFLRTALFLASCLLLASCGAILEEAAEQALEQGGVEVELDDVEDGEFNITIEGDDGEQASIQVDGDEGTVEFESEDGEGSLNLDAGLADNWPAEFPLPDDVSVLTSLGFSENGEQGFTAVFTGPSGSIDRYLDHFRGLAPVASEVEVTSGEGRIWTILWGTEEDPLGSVVLTDTTDEVGGQINLGTFN